jgi:hypothetical protein
MLRHVRRSVFPYVSSPSNDSTDSLITHGRFDILLGKMNKVCKNE